MKYYKVLEMNMLRIKWVRKVLTPNTYFMILLIENSKIGKITFGILRCCQRWISWSGGYVYLEVIHWDLHVYFSVRVIIQQKILKFTATHMRVWLILRQKKKNFTRNKKGHNTLAKCSVNIKDVKILILCLGHN